MTTDARSSEDKALILGTALWGWGVDKRTAFTLLDKYVEQGGGGVDTAVNYPINKRSEDFGLALKWLSEWLAASRKVGVQIVVKIGALDNLGGGANDLSADCIRRTEGWLREVLGDALSVISVHWDNRGSEQRAEIEDTVRELSRIHGDGLGIGLSGVRHPGLYFEAAPELAKSWNIQVKENALTTAARESYMQWFGGAKFFAYGINMGGAKPDATSISSSVRMRNIALPEGLIERMLAFLASDHGLEPRPRTLNELALITAYSNPFLSGVVVGPRDPAQLSETRQFWQQLKYSSAKSNWSAIPSFK